MSLSWNDVCKSPFLEGFNSYCCCRACAFFLYIELPDDEPPNLIDGSQELGRRGRSNFNFKNADDDSDDDWIDGGTDFVPCILPGVKVWINPTQNGDAGRLRTGWETLALQCFPCLNFDFAIAEMTV